MVKIPNNNCDLNKTSRVKNQSTEGECPPTFILEATSNVYIHTLYRYKDEYIFNVHKIDYDVWDGDYDYLMVMIEHTNTQQN